MTCSKCGESTAGWLVDAKGDHVACPTRHGLAAAVAPAPLPPRIVWSGRAWS